MLGSSLLLLCRLLLLLLSLLLLILLLSLSVIITVKKCSTIKNIIVLIGKRVNDRVFYFIFSFRNSIYFMSIAT